MQNALNCQSEDPAFNHVKSLKISMVNFALKKPLDPLPSPQQKQKTKKLALERRS